MLNKTAYCFVSISPVRSAASDTSEIVTQLLFGELVELLEKTLPWVKIRSFADGYEGYVDHKHLRGLSDKETKRWMEGLSYVSNRERLLQTPWGNQYICRGSFAPANCTTFKVGNDQFTWLNDEAQLPTTTPEIALLYLNTPYLWGGKTPFGIDCSGLTQTVFRLVDLNLPRDAAEQFAVGIPVNFDDQLPGDLAFFENQQGKIIHVGIIDSDKTIIHASGHVRKDALTQEGIYRAESGEISHRLCAIRRL